MKRLLACVGVIGLVATVLALIVRGPGRAPGPGRDSVPPASGQDPNSGAHLDIRSVALGMDREQATRVAPVRDEVERVLQVQVVHGATGAPAESEWVRVLRREKDGQGIVGLADRITDADGRFLLTDIAGQSLTLQPYFGAEVEVDGDRCPLIVTLRLEARRPIAGQVVDRAGGPVGGASICVSSDAGLPAGRQVGASDPSGRFAVEVPVGYRRYLWAESEGVQRSALYLVNGEPEPTDQQVLLEVGGAVGDLTVRVFGPRGDPVPDAFVELGKPEVVVQYAARWRGSRGLGAWWGELTDARGEAVFRDCPIGTHRLCVHAREHGPWQQQVLVNGPREVVRVDLRGSVFLRGRVTTSTGAGAPALVRWRPEEDGPVSDVVADGDGTFVLERLAPGWGELEATWERRDVRWEARARLLCGEGTTIELRLLATTSLRLALRDESGNALSGWRAVLLQDGVTDDRVSDGAGELSLSGGEAASRHVAVYGPTRTGWETLPRLVQTLGAIRTVTVPGAAAAVGSLSGRVFGSRGGDLLISRGEESWPAKVEIAVDAAGRFRVDALPPGPCVIWHRTGGFVHRVAAFDIDPGASLDVDISLSK